MWSDSGPNAVSRSALYDEDQGELAQTSAMMAAPTRTNPPTVSVRRRAATRLSSRRLPRAKAVPMGSGVGVCMSNSGRVGTTADQTSRRTLRSAYRPMRSPCAQIGIRPSAATSSAQARAHRRDRRWTTGQLAEPRVISTLGRISRP